MPNHPGKLLFIYFLLLYLISLFIYFIYIWWIKITFDKMNLRQLLVGSAQTAVNI